MDTVKQHIKMFIKAILLDWLYPAVYRHSCKRDSIALNKILFVQGRGSALSDNFNLVFERIDSYGSWDKRTILLREYQVSYPRYCLNCIRLVREIATARYVFLDDASDVISCLPLKKETKVIQLWHACGAFKKFGMSTADLRFGGTKEQKIKHPFYNNLSLVSVSSPEVIWAYVEAMVLENRPEIVRSLGVSRTDIFFDVDFLKEARKKVDEVSLVTSGKKIILYAPTFRGRVINAKGPDSLDIQALKKALGNDYALLVKHHPYVNDPPRIPDDCSDFAFLVDGEELSIEALLAASDVCISDYSSLVFEYSLFVRPMVFFAYDIDDYIDWRGFYYSYEDLTPGPVVATNEELLNYLTHIDDLFDAQEVIDFKNRFMSACDGGATDRILQAVLDDRTVIG